MSTACLNRGCKEFATRYFLTVEQVNGVRAISANSLCENHSKTLADEILKIYRPPDERIDDAVEFYRIDTIVLERVYRDFSSCAHLFSSQCMGYFTVKCLPYRQQNTIEAILRAEGNIHQVLVQILRKAEWKIDRIILDILDKQAPNVSANIYLVRNDTTKDDWLLNRVSFGDGIALSTLTEAPLYVTNSAWVICAGE